MFPCTLLQTASEAVPQKPVHVHAPDLKLKYTELRSELLKRLPTASGIVDKALKAPSTANSGAHTNSKKPSIQSSTLSNEGSKVGLNGPKKSPPAAQVALIILESVESDGAGKDARKTANKSRSRDMLRLKVASALKHCNIAGIFDRQIATNAASSSGVEEVVVELLPAKSSSMFSKTAPAVMVAVDLPFRVLRSVTTIIMYYAQTTSATPASSAIVAASSREEYESLLSNESVAKYRKQVKQLVAELAQYSKYVPGSNFNSNPGASSPAPSASHDHSTVGQKHGLVQVYVFSLVDERFDSVSYDPVMLNQLKWN